MADETRILGVNVVGTTAFFALLGGDGVPLGGAISVQAVADFSRPVDLANTRDTIVQRYEVIRPSHVVILRAESNVDVSHQRAGIETLLALCAHDRGIEASFVARQTVRSALGLPKSGKFGEHVVCCFPEPYKPHWKERGPAALAALATLKAI